MGRHRIKRRKPKPPRRAPAPADPLPTWERLQAAVQALALMRGDLAGTPMPIQDHHLEVARGIPHEARLRGAHLGFVDNHPDGILGGLERRCDVDERLTERNRWWSAKLGTWVHVAWHGVPGDPDFKAEAVYLRYQHELAHLERWRREIDTTHAGMQAWQLAAELKAMETLRTLVTPHQWGLYVMTGAFAEGSRRSQATYVFRRLKPTVVMLPRDDRVHPTCTLCLHPLGYYRDTFAGAMVPTDDVIAHLMLMRGDEHGFWRRANQHPPHHPTSGL